MSKRRSGGGSGTSGTSSKPPAPPQHTLKKDPLKLKIAPSTSVATSSKTIPSTSSPSNPSKITPVTPKRDPPQDPIYKKRGVLPEVSPSKLSYDPVLRGLDIHHRARIALLAEIQVVDNAIHAGKSLTREGKMDIMEAITSMRRMVVEAENEAKALAEGAGEAVAAGMPPAMVSLAPTTPTPDAIGEMISQAVKTEMQPFLMALQDLGSRPRTPSQIEETVKAAIQSELQPIRKEISNLRASVLEELRMSREDLISATLESGLRGTAASEAVHRPGDLDMQKLHAVPHPYNPDRMIETPKVPLIPPKIARPTLFVTVTPKEPINNPQEAITRWKRSVSFLNAGFAPERVIPLEQNRFKIEFATPQMVDKTAKCINSVPEFVATPARRKLPLLILKGIPDEIPQKDLVRALEGQNPISGLRLCYLTANKKAGLYNAVIEVQPGVRKHVIAHGWRLSLGHGKVHAADQTRFVQCYACLKFGHTQSKCRETRRPCSYCADHNHTYKDCQYAKVETKEDPKHIYCVNCEDAAESDTYHSATDRERCPQINKAMARADANTLYEEPEISEPDALVRTPSTRSLSKV